MASLKHDSAKLQELIALIYEASVEPDLWAQLLDQMAEYIQHELNALEGAGGEEAESISIRDILSKHFKRASRLNKKIALLHDNLDATASVLDRLPLGVIFLESGGKIAFTNRRAKLILEGDYDLSQSRGVVSTSSSEINRKIQRHVDEVLNSASTTTKTIDVNNSKSNAFTLSVSSLEAMKITRPSGRHYVVMLIATPEVLSHITQQSLQDIHGLTSAEAKLTLAIVNGGSLEAAVESLSISKHTARSQLKSVFQKIGVNKQSELIKKILTSPEALVANSVQSAMKPIIRDQPWYEMPRHSRYVRLYDGRRLGFAEYGDPEGVPIIVHHGVAASRLQMHPDEEIAIQAGARLIVPDRPGIGLSNFLENRQLVDWPQDIKQLANQLEIERFATIGLTTGGGVFALLCATEIPHLVSAVSLVSTRSVFEFMKPTPTVRPLLGMARMTPTLFYQYLKIMGESVKRNPELYLERRMSEFSEVDQLFLQSNEGRKFYLEPMVEALREGAKGIAWDLSSAMSGGWDFSSENVKHAIKIWHGTDDMIVPIEEAEALAGKLNHCTTSFIENEGQFLFFNYWKDILEELVLEHQNGC